MTNARSIAGKLLDAGVVQLRPEEPFTWASGWKSPIYCDNRRLLSFPYTRDFFKSELSAMIFTDFPEAECIAGVATAGIAWGAMVADQLKLPFIYVRTKPKEHGMGNQIEGNITPLQKVLVIEDLVSTGKSSLEVCQALRNAGLEVCGMVSLFTYGFLHATEAFKHEGIRYQSLTNYSELVEEAVSRGLISEGHLNTLLNWREQPDVWSGIQ